MTPFEQAEKNCFNFVDGLMMQALVLKTIEETATLDEATSTTIWLAVLLLLENAGKLGDIN